MAAIRIETGELVRALTAHDFKLVEYFLDRDTGRILARVAPPEAVHADGRAVLPTKKEKPPTRKPATETKPRSPEKKDPFTAIDAQAPPAEAKPADPFAALGSGPTRQKPKNPFALIDAKGETETKPRDPFVKLGGKRSSPSTRADIFAKIDRMGPKEETRVDLFRPDETIPPEWLAERADGLPRALKLEPLDPETGYSFMSEFARQCGDPRVRELLQQALQGESDVFRRFHQVLERYARTREQWRAYYFKRTKEHAARWLDELGIEYELVEEEPPTAPEAQG